MMEEEKEEEEEKDMIAIGKKNWKKSVGWKDTEVLVGVRR